MPEIAITDKLARLTDRQREIAQAALAWGYGSTHFNRRVALWQGRTMLDIGMGGGPHCIPYLLGGATGYIGVDPLVGTDKVHDKRSQHDPSIPTYHAFPYSVDEMMEAFPNLHLYSARMEDAAEMLQRHRPDLIVLSSVTEHLTNLDSVIQCAHAVSAPNSVIWISHANYYSWSGHHRPPRTVEDWKRGCPDTHGVTDWRHLEHTHPCYSHVNLNRIRLGDFRAVIDKYFKIYEWRVVIDALDRLTPEIRQRWKQYTLEELAGRTIFVCGVRRDVPLETAIDVRQLFHPADDHRSTVDYSSEDPEPLHRSNLVYFRDAERVVTHAYNNQEGGRIMANLASGDRIVLQKFPWLLECTIKGARKLSDRLGWVEIEGRLPDDIAATDDGNWTIVSTTPRAEGNTDVSPSGVAPRVRVVAEEIKGWFPGYAG